MINESILVAVDYLSKSSPFLGTSCSYRRILSSSGDPILYPEINKGGIKNLSGSMDVMLVMASSPRMAALNILALEKIDTVFNKNSDESSERVSLETNLFLSLMEMVLLSIKDLSSGSLLFSGINIDVLLDYERKHLSGSNILSSSFMYPIIVKEESKEMSLGTHFESHGHPFVYCDPHAIDNYPDIYAPEGVLSLFLQSHNLISSAENLYHALKKLLNGYSVKSLDESISFAEMTIKKSFE